MAVSNTFQMPDDPRDRAELFRRRYEAVRNEIGKVIVGQLEVVDTLLRAFFAGGNVLLEGVPGLGKTMLVRTLADAMRLEFSRIQFTPDLMPADVVGTLIVSEDAASGRRSLTFQKGPIFSNLVLADEVNRATPKTQSALLEAMQEHSVTVGGTTHRVPEPFLVIATHPENPTAPESVRKYVRFGSSPRGGQGLVLLGKVRALLEGRYNVSFRDVALEAPSVLRHRLIRNFEAEADRVDGDQIVADVVKSVPQQDLLTAK